MTEPIVSFTDPPVVEVSAGVMFPDLGPTGVALASSFWRDQLRTDFPVVQFQPPYVGAIEQFAGGQPAFPQIRMLAGYPTPRLWATGDDGQHLIQVQPDWFACNWRRVQPKDAYPRWGSRREEFNLWFNRFSEYATANGTPLGLVSQCEVTYINHIAPNAVFKTHRDFGRVFEVGVSDRLVPAEQFSMDMKFAIEDPEGIPIGRLHINIQPAFNAESNPIYVLQLTARGHPPDGDVLAFLDRGRALIDETFVSLTTTEMQNEWGRTQ